MKKTIIYLMAFLATFDVFAQRTKTVINPRSNTPFQLSFIYPVSTSGWMAIENDHKVSVHLLAGATKSTNGVEVAGFANFNKTKLHGVQAAGFTNILGGEGDGVQASGFANLSLGEFSGVQASGFCNVSLKSFDGVQAAGFANYLSGGKGVQAAGFTNLNLGAGEGLQASGFLNFALKGQRGAQIAGFSNVALGQSSGVQISGFLNVAQKHKRAQIAVFNFADTLDGLAIGLISFSRNGYHRFELSSNETFQTQLAFKTGNKAFYNIFLAGAHWDKEQPIWSLGYGIGTSLLDLPKWSAEMDLTASALFPEDFEQDEWASLSALRISLTRKFGEFEVFGGGSINALFYENANQNTDFVPWIGFEGEDQNTRYIVYPGFQFGVRL